MNRDNSQDMNNQEDMSLTTRHARRARLSQVASALIYDASLTSETTSFVLNEFELLHGKVKKINGGRSVLPESFSKKSSEEPKSILNPSLVRSKRCGKRIKSSKEMSISKARLCGRCGLRGGQSHDKRNCPNLLERSTIDERDINSDSPSDEDETLSSAGSNMLGA